MSPARVAAVSGPGLPRVSPGLAPYCRLSGFGAGFACPSVLLFLAAVDLWFSTTRVVIGAGKVKIRRSTLGVASTKEIPFSEIEEVKLSIGMQQSKTATQSAKAYYDIEIHRKFGKKVKAGRNIRNKREAEWIVEQMRGLIMTRH